MKRLDFKAIPFGPDHPIEEKIKWAELLYKEIATGLKEDGTFCRLFEDYQRAIDESWQVMKYTGVVKECTLCATVDGGSCCGAGIENKFDVVGLLINLFWGIRLPKEPFDVTGCWFLGEKGCLLRARHVICVNFLCKRLYSRVPEREIRLVQRAIEKETEASFILEEYIKHWLKKRSQQL